MKTSGSLEKLLPFITKKEFLNSEQLGNEIGFYIFDYEPSEELLVRSQLQKISKKLTSSHQIQTITINLYERLIESLKNEELLDEFLKIDATRGTETFQSQISPLLEVDLSDKNNYMSLIKDDVSEADIIFITGVGTAWPLIRSHVVLNNLQAIVGSTPVILFLPGSYDKTKIQLFSTIQSNNYYRAFRIRDLLH